MRRTLASSGLALAASLIPQHALAHSSLPGIRGFYTGLTHPFTSFDQLLALLGLGVMLGVGRKEWFARSWPAYAIFTVIGTLLGSLGYLHEIAGLLLLFIAFFSAAMAAIYPTGILALSVVLSSLCGLFMGVTSAPAPGPVLNMVFTSLGSLVGANVGLLFVSGAAIWVLDLNVGQWSLVAVRIIAAWIATISISIVALYLTTL